MTVVIPRTLDAAIGALRQDPEATLLAGGTDLMVEINFGRRRPHRVISLARIPELAGWRREGDTLWLGAGLTYAELGSPELAALAPALAQAARTVGSPQIRNAGTIGGNIATASPAGDTLPVLVALDATIELYGPGGVRALPVGEFLVGPKRTARRPDEIILGARIPVASGPQEFLKVGTRNAMVISVVGVALTVDLTDRRVACALGSVGPVVLRAATAETWLHRRLVWSPDGVALEAGGDGDPERWMRTFGELAAGDARPIDDHRSTAAYRRHAVSVCASRALRRCLTEQR